MRAHVKDVCFTGYTSYIPYLWAFYLVTNPVTLLVTYFLNWLHLAAYLIGFGYCGQKLGFAEQNPFAQIKGKKKKPLGFSLRGDSPEGSLSLPLKLSKGLALSQIQLQKDK